jgi:alpha-N-arabinofuranosidase
MTENKAIITIDRQSVISDIDRRIYGSFIEHFGRAVYGGIYEPDHPGADEQGFRRDVLDIVKELDIPVVRYPGGNFVSGYRWEDGVGPKEARKVRLDLAWTALEPNEIGLNEFMDWLKKAGADMMLAVNLGTRGPEAAQDLVEYCNFPSGTALSDLRISHGYPEPHNIKLWCLGNEMDGPWQICAKTAEEYGRAACETAKVMKWVDPDIELVVCGSSGKGMPTFGTWEETVLRHTYEHVDYVSLHTYYGNTGGDTPSFLASALDMDVFIKEVAGICEKVRQEKGLTKKVYLSFDEWNVWYHYSQTKDRPPKWIVGRPIQEENYNVEDALVVGDMLITLINNADVVKIACLAQLVNTIAPIMTMKGGPAWRQTIFYPFQYTSLYGRGRALHAGISSPTYACAKHDAVPAIASACVYNEDAGEVVFFIVNRSLTKDIKVECTLDGFDVKGAAQWVALEGYDLMDENTADNPDNVVPHEKEGVTIGEGAFVFTVSEKSWNMIRIEVS